MGRMLAASTAPARHRRRYASRLSVTQSRRRCPARIQRCVCAAGHKAMYSDVWGGLPAKDFLKRLDPKLADLRDRLFEKAYAADRPAGALSKEWAAKLGLREGIKIAMGAFDAHYGAVGSGVRAGTLVKIIGTSTCDCAVASAKEKVQDVYSAAVVLPVGRMLMLGAAQNPESKRALFLTLQARPR